MSAGPTIRKIDDVMASIEANLVRSSAVLKRLEAKLEACPLPQRGKGIKPGA
jgi:hypothetical protein